MSEPPAEVPHARLAKGSAKPQIKPKPDVVVRRSPTGKSPSLPPTTTPTSQRRKRLSTLAQDVLKPRNMKYLMGKSDEMGVDTEDCETKEQILGKILNFIGKSKYVDPAPAPLAGTRAVFSDFAARRTTFLNLIEDIENFLQDEEVLPWLQKMQITSNDVWLLPANFREVKDSAKKRPVLLIAGSTSSGKSTFANALLGEDILPTSHNAATSILCEIKYGLSKQAALHVEEAGQTFKELVDLTTDEGRKKFESVVSPERDGHQPSCPDNASYSTVEIFLPLEFLKDFTLVDSPGVTEEYSESSPVRDITERCQRDMACGFIYVLDASRSAEEASQAGGLLEAVTKGTKQKIPPEAALFVANKWDLLRQEDRDERDQFFQRTVTKIQASLQGFKQHQLIPMNSRLAGQAQKVGETTDDMKRLSEGMKAMLPKSMHYMLEKALSRPSELMDVIEQILESTLREFQLDPEERMRKQSEDWKKLKSFEESLISGKAADVSKKLKEKISILLEELSQYLTSDAGYQQALKWKKSSLPQSQRENYDKRNVEDLVLQRFCEAIGQSPQFESVLTWANDELAESVSEAMKELNMLNADISAIKVSKPSIPPSHDESAEFETNKAVVAAAVAIAVPAVVVGIPLALAIGIIAAPIYAVIKAISSFRKSNFKMAVEAAYKQLVQAALANDHELLRKVTTSLLTCVCTPIEIILKQIPDKIEGLRKELIAREVQKEEDKPQYEAVLQKCRTIKGKLSKFHLELDTHMFEENDLTWPEARVPAAIGSFGAVYKVTLPNKQEAALKEMKAFITEDNSEMFMKELNSCSAFTNDYVVKFYGTVQLSNSPLKLGLLFEWCGGGTLASFIDGSTRPPPFESPTKGFPEGQRVAREMLSGLTFLHSNSIIHRDLKPENVMMTSGSPRRAKLGDMGLAKPMDQVKGTLCGTLLYMAPEVFLHKPYSTKVDMFSIGIILWEIWNMKRAYTADKMKQMGISEFFNGVTSGDIRPNHGKFMGEETVDDDSQQKAKAWGDVARRCWSSVADERPTAKEAFDDISAIR